MAYITVDGEDHGDVRVYAMSSCAWCDKMKRLLSDNGVAFRFVDLDKVEESLRQEITDYLDSIYPKWGFPCLLYDKKLLIVGYQEDEILDTLGLHKDSVKESPQDEEPLDAEAHKAMDKLQRYVEKRGAYLNPNGVVTAKLIKGIQKNKKRYGYWACPCRLASGNIDEDRDIICPCDYWAQDVEEYGACYCGLFVSKKVKNGVEKLRPVPERRARK